MADLFAFNGPVTFNSGAVAITVTADVSAVLARLDQLGTQMTTIDEALAALDAHVNDLAVAAAADRAAFDALATAVRALIANLPPAGGVLTADQAAAADALLAKIDATKAAEDTEAADEGTLTAEVPATP